MVQAFKHMCLWEPLLSNHYRLLAPSQLHELGHKKDNREQGSQKTTMNSGSESSMGSSARLRLQAAQLWGASVSWLGCTFSQLRSTPEQCGRRCNWGDTSTEEPCTIVRCVREVKGLSYLFCLVTFSAYFNYRGNYLDVSIWSVTLNGTHIRLIFFSGGWKEKRWFS